MVVELIHIPFVDPMWFTVNQVRALAIDGREFAITALRTFRKNDVAGFNQILDAIQLAAENHRVNNPNRVKPCKRRKGIYEFIGRNFRLHFFYHKETIVCLNSYIKTKPSKKEQNKAIDKANRLKEIFDDQYQG